MELRPGYKETEIGVIPEDWDVQGLLSTVRIATGQVDPKAAPFDEMPLIAPDHIESGTGRLLEIRTARQQNAISGKYLFSAGDIVYSKIRPYLRKAILADFGGLCSADMYPLRPELGISGRYILDNLLAHRFTKYAESVSVRSGMPKINRVELADFRIPLPKPPEQKAIAEALSDVDASIAALSRLIAKKRDLRQGAMQRLLTGQTRLPGFTAQWQESRLGAIGRFIKGNGVRRDEAQSGDLPCVRYGEIYTTHHNVVHHFTSYISRAVAHNATRIQRGDLLFAASGETKEEIGKCVALAHDGEAYAGGDIIILRPTSGNPVFLGYLLNMPDVVRQKANKGQGDAVVHIGATALAAIEIGLPEEPEQAAIAKVLSNMDAEITVLEARLDKTRALKQAMMQALLTGRVRLPIPRDVAPQTKEAAYA